MMQIHYKKAQALCTDSEFSLLTQAKPVALAKLGVSELKKKVSQARKLADKWREQSRKQGSPKNGAAERSKQKHELFQEALNRFEAKLTKLEAAPVTKVAKKIMKKIMKKAAKKVAVKAARKMSKIPSLAKKSRKSPSPMDLAFHATQKSIGTDLRIAASGQNSRIRGHISSVGRRNQAARSSRKPS